MRNPPPLSPSLESPTSQPAGLWRRLFAMLYDALLIVALLMMVTAILLVFTGPEGLYPPPWWYPTLLLGAWFWFFAWCWRRGGATLGMQAWRLRVEMLDGRPLSWKASALRFFGGLLSAACLGLGYVWVLFDPQRRAWHDRLSGTRVLHLVPLKKLRKRKPTSGRAEPGPQPVAETASESRAD